MNQDLTALQRAAVVMKHLREELERARDARTEPIAVLGMACRLPGGVKTPEDYWQLLSDGTDAIREIPRDRWNADDYYDPNLSPGTMNTRWGGFIDDVDQFDPTFFDLGQREASIMDPQQRILLETTWEALEDAAIPPDQTAGTKTGVFVGMCNPDYATLHAIPPPRGNTGVSMSIAANRLSYWFDWTGPSAVVDTACSASLLSVHLAAASLRRDECELAVAGGVNVILWPMTTVSFAQAGMMAPDGRCKTFDATANGYVRGEGCGMVVLKRLSRALRDGDRILAVIRGSATNQDGRTNGLTAPKGVSQESVIRAALDASGLTPDQIGYVEAHGTGTPLGDAVEVGALASVLGDGRAPDQVCVLSAAKSNIGHLESAAGVAGLIKVILALQNEAIPPVVHFRSLNPKISFGAVPFIIPEQIADWPQPRGSRYAGLSSFSFGGSNVHLVVGEAPLRPRPGMTTNGAHLLPLSAKAEAALRPVVLRMAEFLALHPDLPVADVCYTAACGRSHFPYRFALVASSTTEMAAALGRAAQGPLPVPRPTPNLGSTPRMGIVFVNQEIWDGTWAATLYATEARFRHASEELVAPLRALTSQSFAELLANPHPEARGISKFAFQYTQARLFISLGVADWSAGGRGAGHWVAAALNGTTPLETALRKAAREENDESPDPGSNEETTSLLRGRGCTEILWIGTAPVTDAYPLDASCDPRTHLLHILGDLYVAGHSIDWSALQVESGGVRIGLPTYPFQRRRCWLEPHEVRSLVGVGAI
ncbi:MAG: beta-ketoacyl synthase N-terminal-like domain-containing protein [Terracidiphilus sp.]